MKKTKRVSNPYISGFFYGLGILFICLVITIFISALFGLNDVKSWFGGPFLGFIIFYLLGRWLVIDDEADYQLDERLRWTAVITYFTISILQYLFLSNGYFDVFDNAGSAIIFFSIKIIEILLFYLVFGYQNTLKWINKYSR